MKSGGVINSALRTSGEENGEEGGGIAVVFDVCVYGLYLFVFKLEDLACDIEETLRGVY